MTIHLHRIRKYIGRGQRFGVEGMGKGNGELAFNGDSVSGKMKVLAMDGGTVAQQCECF